MTEPDAPTVPAEGELRQRVIASICTLLPHVLGREIPDVSEATRLMELQLTSASTLALMLEVEDALEIQIDVEEFDQQHLESVGTLAGYVAGHALAYE